MIVQQACQAITRWRIAAIVSQSQRQRRGRVVGCGPAADGGDQEQQTAQGGTRDSGGHRPPSSVCTA